MHRESDKHGPLRDDALRHELEGTLHGNRPGRVEEWRDPEPPADDDPVLHHDLEEWEQSRETVETSQDDSTT